MVAECPDTFTISKSALKTYLAKLKRGDHLIQDEREKLAFSHIRNKVLKPQQYLAKNYIFQPCGLINIFDKVGEKSSSTSHAGLG